MYLDRRRSQAIGQALAAEDCTTGAAFARTSSAELFAQVEASLSSLDDLIASLGGMPGPKALLYVSDGLPLRSGEEVFFELARSPLCSDGAFLMTSSVMAIAAEYDHTNSLRQLSAHANTNRVTFYPLEAVGIRSFSSSDIEIGPRVMANSGEGWTDSADRAMFPSGAPANLSAAGPIDSTDEFVFRSNHQGSLFYLADQTGGRAVLNANDLLPDLRRIDRQLRNHYSLGFVPTLVGRGRLHQLQVRLTRPDLKISHRQSFADLPWSQRTADQLQSLLTHDGHWDNPLAVRVETVGIEASRRGRYDATLRLTLPAAALVLEPADDERQTGSLRILITAQDSAGRRTDLRTIELPVAFSAAQLQEHPDLNSVHKIQMTVEEGDLDVGLAVLDESARIASFIRHPVAATSP
jgi:VWFA-related protein